MPKFFNRILQLIAFACVAFAILAVVDLLLYDLENVKSVLEFAIDMYKETIDSLLELINNRR